MVIEQVQSRFKQAVDYLSDEQIIDSKNVVKCISEKMGRHPNNVRGALRGEAKFLTRKFVKTFCSVFNNLISPNWIWDGLGNMFTNKPILPLQDELPEESLTELSKEELITLIKELIKLHCEQNEMYRLLVKQNEEMIRNGQSRFNDITNLIYRNVSAAR